MVSVTSLAKAVGNVRDSLGNTRNEEEEVDDMESEELQKLRSLKSTLNSMDSTRDDEIRARMEHEAEEAIELAQRISRGLKETAQDLQQISKELESVVNQQDKVVTHLASGDTSIDVGKAPYLAESINAADEDISVLIKEVNHAREEAENAYREITGQNLDGSDADVAGAGSILQGVEQLVNSEETYETAEQEHEKRLESMEEELQTAENSLEESISLLKDTEDRMLEVRDVAEDTVQTAESGVDQKRRRVMRAAGGAIAVGGITGLSGCASQFEIEDTSNKPYTWRFERRETDTLELGFSDKEQFAFVLLDPDRHIVLELSIEDIQTGRTVLDSRLLKIYPDREENKIEALTDNQLIPLEQGESFSPSNEFDIDVDMSLRVTHVDKANIVELLAAVRGSVKLDTPSSDTVVELVGYRDY